MSSVKMIGIAEHCDLSCDWIIKAVFWRRWLHCLWRSAAGVTQDKLLLRLDCTSHQWCNYEIDVVLIQIAIWKPIIDRSSWRGGRRRRAFMKNLLCGPQTISWASNMTHDHAPAHVASHPWAYCLGSHFCLAGGKYEDDYLSCSTVKSVTVALPVSRGRSGWYLQPPRYHSRIMEREQILRRGECGSVRKCKKRWRAGKGQPADSTTRRFLSQLLALPVCSLAAGFTQHLQIQTSEVSHLPEAQTQELMITVIKSPSRNH